MATIFMTRGERFQQFQELLKEVKNGQEPEKILARLYNGFTAEFSKAEAEIQRLRQSTSVLTKELADLNAIALQVGSEPHPKVRSHKAEKSLSGLPQPKLPAQCCKYALGSKLAESRKQ